MERETAFHQMTSVNNSSALSRPSASVQSVSDALTTAAKEFDLDAMKSGVRELVAKVANAERER